MRKKKNRIYKEQRGYQKPQQPRQPSNPAKATRREISCDLAGGGATTPRGASGRTPRGRHCCGALRRPARDADTHAQPRRHTHADERCTSVHLHARGKRTAQTHRHTRRHDPRSTDATQSPQRHPTHTRTQGAPARRGTRRAPPTACDGRLRQRAPPRRHDCVCSVVVRDCDKPSSAWRGGHRDWRGSLPFRQLLMAVRC